MTQSFLPLLLMSALLRAVLLVADDVGNVVWRVSART